MDEADDLSRQRNLRQLVQHRNDALQGDMSRHHCGLDPYFAVFTAQTRHQMGSTPAVPSWQHAAAFAPKSGGPRTPQRTESVA